MPIPWLVVLLWLAMDLLDLRTGQRASVVLAMICFDPLGMNHLMQSQDRRGYKIWVKGHVPFGTTVTGVDLLVTSTSPFRLEVDATASVFPVPACDRPALTRVVDLCSGLGGFSCLVSRVGFSVIAGVDQNRLWKKLFEGLHEGAVFVAGDLTDPMVLRDLLSQGPFHGVACAGVSCQPHSVLGDRRGMDDPRAQSLPKTLHLAWLMQSAVLLLECTPEVLRDAKAQELLRQFTVATGYRLQQTILRLSDTWCTRRDRWIAVLTAPVIATCELPDMPKLGEIHVVKDLIPEFRLWHQFEQEQLVLNLYELSKYYQYASGGMDSVWIKMQDQLPTLLHSAGNQMYTCACGCRAALSETRLRQKGLVGTLIPLPTCQIHMNTRMQHARYLHPLEMWALMGGKPNVSMGHNMRLAMSGVGQAVAPVMGLWIFAHVRKALDLTFDLPPCDPVAILRTYMDEVVDECRKLWPLKPMPTEITATVEDPIEDDPSLECSQFVTVSRPCTGEPDVTVRPSPEVTGTQLLAAEASLGALVAGSQLRIDGEAVDASQPLKPSTLVSIVPPDWDPNQLYAEPVIPCCLSADSFLRHVHASDASASGPVTTLDQLSDVRVPEFARAERLGLVSLQGPVWGDDELLHGLTQTAIGTDDDQHVHVWDPVLVTGLVHQEDFDTWRQLVDPLGSIATVISAVLLGGHWLPLVWRVDTVGTKLHTLSVASAFEANLDSLARVIELQRGGARGVWQSHNPGFVPAGNCGALVLAFVRHLLWGFQMVTDQASLDYVAIGMREDFVAALADSCFRPLLAGLGVSTHGRLVDLLTSHGVAVKEGSSRADATLKALGEEKVAQALNSDNPWRELKWLGNQLRPPFMLVKPSELQAQIALRSGDTPVGNKKHKHGRPQKGKGKGGVKPAVCVDPALLRLEHGIFQSADGLSLSQISLPQVGPSAAGVAVVSVGMIGPYLQAGHPLSSGPLALFVVDAVEAPQTSFPVCSERVPLVCAANSEPLLVDGHLIQLGAVGVQRTPVQTASAVPAIPTCVVKAMIFRDQTKLPWPEVTAHPLLHIFSLVPPLMVCKDLDCCGCECWHRSPMCPMDSPVMELWGKQWLTLDFSNASPDKAELFTAHLRLPEQLQLLVQQFSGHDGVYLEPKSLDGRRCGCRGPTCRN